MVDHGAGDQSKRQDDSCSGHPTAIEIPHPRISGISVPAPPQASVDVGSVGARSAWIRALMRSASSLRPCLK